MWSVDIRNTYDEDVDEECNVLPKGFNYRF